MTRSQVHLLSENGHSQIDIAERLRVGRSPGNVITSSSGKLIAPSSGTVITASSAEAIARARAGRSPLARPT